MTTRPFLSVIVACYNMSRELPRTLFSLAPAYQGLPAEAYEVVVVDNGSVHPPSVESFHDLGIDLTILTIRDPSPSPAAALNRGVAESRGDVVCIYIDGARIASPGLLRSALQALRTDPRAIVASRGRYLGLAPQRESILTGYNQTIEDRLLARSGWETNGYRLFGLSVLDESSGELWFDAIAESNSLFLPRHLLTELGGLDERFSSPGGGLVNLDLWVRACELPDILPIVLLGEATFHQYHGGAATAAAESALGAMLDEYESLLGHPYEVPTRPLMLWGRFVAPIDVTELAHHPADPPTSASTQLRWPLRLLPPAALRRLRPLAVAVRATLTGRRAEYRAFVRAEDDTVRLVENSGLFDARWYAEHYPDVTAAGFDPVRHYLRFGRAEQRQPGPRFDARWYLTQHHDIRRNPNLNPLVHYVRHGRGEGRPTRLVDLSDLMDELDAEIEDTYLVASSWLFDSDWYVATYPDVRSSGLPPDLHYVRAGRAQGRHPSPHFDAVRYLEDHPDVRATSMNPLVHYLRSGQAEQRIVRQVRIENRPV